MVAEGKEILVAGRFPRIARLQAEHYEWVESPGTVVSELKASGAGADLFTFLQPVTDRTPRHSFHMEYDSIAVLSISSYEQWWKKQIRDKTRNMVRKAEKSGVEIREVPFDDRLIRGIKGVYDETPMRQGRPFRHYGKDLETLKRDHASFLERSQFIGAFHGGELIGFIKVVHEEEVSHLMQILSKVGHREKAPTNALIAKTVQICAERGTRYLHYSDWDRRGIGDFKRHHGFEQMDLPRYYVPLNRAGQLFLQLKLHRSLADLMPERLYDGLKEVRNRLNAVRYGRA